MTLPQLALQLLWYVCYQDEYEKSSAWNKIENNYCNILFEPLSNLMSSIILKNHIIF